MKYSAAAIAAFLSRLRPGRPSSFVARVSLRRARKTANSDQNLAPFVGGSNKPALHNEKAVVDKVRVQLRFDGSLLARADAAANRQGITRTAWLHRAAFDALEGRVASPTD
jgi:hypothetical protein